MSAGRTGARGSNTITNVVSVPHLLTFFCVSVPFFSRFSLCDLQAVLSTADVSRHNKILCAVGCTCKLATKELSMLSREAYAVRVWDSVCVTAGGVSIVSMPPKRRESGVCTCQ